MDNVSIMSESINTDRPSPIERKKQTILIFDALKFCTAQYSVFNTLRL
jgi:hypothetical protein